MKLGKVEIRFLHEKWPNWALGFWFYYKWFGIQILMFKLVVDEYIDWDEAMKPLEWSNLKGAEDNVGNSFAQIR